MIVFRIYSMRSTVPQIFVILLCDCTPQAGVAGALEDLSFETLHFRITADVWQKTVVSHLELERAGNSVLCKCLDV